MPSMPPDGSPPTTPNQLAAHLAQASRELDGLSRALHAADREVTRLRENLTLAYSRAFIKVDGPQYLRKEIAKVETTAERQEVETAELIVRGIKRQIRSQEKHIDALRSAGALMRSEIALTGRDGYA